MSEVAATPDVAEKPARRARKKPAKADAAPPALTTFQTGQTVVVVRTAIKNASYNPRSISPEAKRRLKEEIKRHGYLDRAVVRRLDDNDYRLVRGHQRLACLDALNGGKDYSLEVTVVDGKDDQWEMEANISGNAATLTGEWDLPLLQELYTKHKIAPEATGFTSKELGRYYGIELTPAQQQLAELDAQIAEIESFKAKNAEMVDDVSAQDNPEFFLVVQVDDQHRALMVFESQPSRKAFTDLLGLADGRYQDARSFALKAVSVAPDDGEWMEEKADESDNTSEPLSVEQ